MVVSVFNPLQVKLVAGGSEGSPVLSGRKFRRSWLFVTISLPHGGEKQRGQSGKRSAGSLFESGS